MEKTSKKQPWFWSGGRLLVQELFSSPYVGKLQLIASVLASMHVYWASVFLLPKTVVKEISRLMKDFLWNYGDDKKGKAKVSWKLICNPKDKGGLGLKELGLWNEALLSKHIWHIAARKKSLWFKWVNIVKLKGRSIWDVVATKKDSFMWKSLLNLRSKIRDSIIHCIGNGRDTSMWYDCWDSSGPLCNVITKRDIYAARLNEDTNVADMIIDGGWNWPHEWLQRYPNLANINVPVLNGDLKDHVKWKMNSGDLVDFSMQNVWEKFKPMAVKVNWCKVVWFSQGNPRHAFIMWLAIQGRLLTQDRMLRWCLGSNLLCPLCRKVNDSHNHLFFCCDYSIEVWKAVKRLIHLDNFPNDWDNIVSGIAAMPCNNNIKSVLRRMILAATVYYVWKERNDRLFKQKSKPTEIIIRSIMENIKMQLMCLKVKPSRQILRIAREWNVQMHICGI